MSDTRYEYKVAEMVGMNGPSIEADLNALGAEGWELIEFSYATRIAVFKRKVQTHE
jgi:hypothetical protein